MHVYESLKRKSVCIHHQSIHLIMLMFVIPKHLIVYIRTTKYISIYLIHSRDAIQDLSTRLI